MKIIFATFLLILTVECYQEAPCSNEGGNCQEISGTCPGVYKVGYCPTQFNSIRCCIPDRDEEPCKGEGGQCRFTTSSCGTSFLSGKCPTQPSNVKCCTGLCEPAVKTMACEILNHSRVKLLEIQVSGVSDGADPLSNIRDTCEYRKARRSNYGTAPGSSVCLQSKMLSALKEVLDNTPKNYSVQVNSVAGGSHSATSKHYEGRAFDLQSRNFPRSIWMDIWVKACLNHQGTVFHKENASGHDGHVHCQF